MNKEKQIEEMARAVEQARIKATDTTNSMNYGFGGWYAKELYNAGYRKADEVAREIFGMLRIDLKGEVDMEYLERLLTIYEKKYESEKDK